VYRATAELGEHPATGKRWTKSRTLRGTRNVAKAAAEVWFAELCERLSDPDLVGRSEQPLSRYLASWHESKRDTIKESTWRRYDSLIASMLPALGDVRLCDLTPQHVREYLATCRDEVTGKCKYPDEVTGKRTCGDGATGKGTCPVDVAGKCQCRTLSPKTVANRLGVLNAAYRQALKEGLVPRNPLESVDKPRCTRSPLRIVGEHEAAVLRRAAEGTDLDALVHLALGSGARLGELLALRWQDVDFERGVLHISRTLYERPVRCAGWYDFTETKGGRGRSLDLDVGTLAALKRHRTRQSEQRLQLGETWQDQGLIFANTWQLRNVAPGSPIRVSTISRQFHVLADHADLHGVRFHDLRHAHATIMLRAGVPVHVVAARLGHSDPALTLRVYSHVLPGQQKDAAALVGEAIEKALKAL
jgi:integrase